MNKNYLEKKIRNLLIDASNEINNYIHLELNNPDKKLHSIDIVEKFIETQQQYEITIRKLSNCICCYLDTNKSKGYLKVFKNKIIPKLSNHEELYDSDDSFCSGPSIGKLVNEIWEFLCPFEFIEADEIDIYLQRSGIVYLENILKNTNLIIKSASATPNSEKEVCDLVKIVINCIFPKSKNPRTNFLKTAKQYFPDILIPELAAAVEYKYAKDENTLKKVIDEISIDQKGYTGDSDYKIFYAVFYVTQRIWTDEKFKEIWKEKNFPKNWKGFYVIR